MRSSRSGPEPLGPDPLWPGPNGFAHRGLHKAPSIVENTLTAFAAALELGAGIECDVRLTADDRLVVFHDSDASRLTGSPRRIGPSTLKQLADLRVGGHPIATLDGTLAMIAGRVPLLVEVKVEGPEFWRIGPALRRVLAGYSGPVGVMSFDPRVARWLKSKAGDVRRGLVVRDSLSPVRRWLAMKLADPHFLAVDIAALDKSWVAAVRARIPVYSWTSRSSGDAQRVRRFADAAIWEDDGRG
jgi:glycerophosphoryl diester phosphodiesterase